MSDKENKVQFNLKNLHYALLTETVTATGTTYVFGTPVRVPGAVNLNLEQQGSIQKFYADGIVYYKAAQNNGYEGDLEMARFIDKMMQEIWGAKLGATSKVLTEYNNVEPKAFALLFQIDGDEDNDLYVLYNCVGTRPAISSKTNEETKEPVTQSSTISATALEDGRVMARTTAETPDSIKNAWFTKVFEESDAA